MREKADDYTHRIFEHSSRIAAKSNIAISMPRVSQRQRHRANTQFTSIEDYFKKVVIIPFLDHLISNLSYRFDAHMKQAAGIQRLIPTNITEELVTCNIRAVNFYKDDLQNPDVIDEELHRWKLKWLAMPLKDRPQNLSSTLKESGSFPNIFTLLKLFATLPLTSCSCERSASALCRFNNYMRCSQTEQRLTSLALIHSNYGVQIDADTVCRKFIEKHLQRMEHANMLFSNTNAASNHIITN